MSAIRVPKKTVADYFATERTSDVKYEYYNGHIVAMAGASRQHNSIKENLSIEVGGRLKGGSCRTYSSEMRVKVERTGLYTYPDFIIVCGTPEFEKVDGLDTLLNPLVVGEILSDSTEKKDRGFKYLNFQRLPSVREYVLVSQHEVRVERFVRQSDETWVHAVFEDPAGSFTFASVPVTVPIADIYRGVEFTEEELP